MKSFIQLTNIPQKDSHKIYTMITFCLTNFMEHIVVYTESNETFRWEFKVSLGRAELWYKFSKIHWSAWKILPEWPMDPKYWKFVINLLSATIHNLFWSHKYQQVIDQINV